MRKRQPRLCKVIEASGPLSVRQVFEKIYEYQTVKARSIYEIFCRNKLDAIILPGFGSATPKLGSIGKLQYCFSLTVPFNVLAYPVGNLPVTVVQNDET